MPERFDFKSDLQHLVNSALQDKRSLLTLFASLSVKSASYNPGKTFRI